MRRIVSIWFPEFPVERFIRARRKARRSAPPVGLPFALVEGGAKGVRLVAVNAAARQFGLSRAQRLADARAAVPDLLTEQHEPEKDQTSLLGLCHWLERYSPWVSPDGKDGALLDITGVAHLFGGEGNMLGDVEKRLKAYGFSPRLGVAGTIGAAWALARYGTTSSGDLHLLPVEALRIEMKAAHTLRRLGLKTVGALISIPRASLARRFRGETISDNVLLRLDEMLGHRSEPLNPLNPPSSFMAHRALMEPVIHHEGLLAVLQGLTRQLALDLEAQGQGALRLILKLFRSDGTRAQLPAGLSAPSFDAHHLYRLLQPRLEQLDAGFGIDAMTLEARETALVQAHQYGFAEDTSAQKLSEFSDRVLNRQDQGVQRLEAMASHLPEKAEAERDLSRPSDTLPKGEGHRYARSRSCALPSGEGGQRPGEVPSASRPLMIFEAPEPALVIAAVPDGPPMRLTWRRVTRRIIKSAGPERIAPEWWRMVSHTRPRDYYRIEDEQGRRYWIYREGLYGEEGEAPPKWFVHGLSP